MLARPMVIAVSRQMRFRSPSFTRKKECIVAPCPCAIVQKRKQNSKATGFLSLQTRGDDSERGDGRGLGAENARPQRCCDPAIGIEERFFFGSPSALRPDGDLQRGHLRLCRCHCLIQSVAKS